MNSINSHSITFMDKRTFK